jgi:O-antigen/teichoic acid export membrane protein
LDKEIGKNIWYASIGSIVPAIFAFFFLFIATKIVSVDTIGLVAVISSFVTLVASIINVGAPQGMKRYLGIYFSRGEMGRFKQFFTSTMVFVLLGIVLSSILLAIPQLRILETMGISYDYVWIVIAMIVTTGFNAILYEPLIATLNSKKTILPLIIGSLTRFPILLIFVYLFNMETIGTMIAYASMIFVSTAFYVVYVFKMLKGIQKESFQTIVDDCKILFHASWVSWGPGILSTLGTQLGILIIFISKGSAEAGIFYIPLAIFSIIRFIPNGISLINQPVVAGMTSIEQQTKFLSNTLKLGFILTMPIATPLLIFSTNFLQLFGNDWVLGASMLKILMIALPIVIINGIVGTFVYGRGDHRSVFHMGLANSITSTILYFILVPILGGNGASLAYVSGALINFIVIVYVAKKQMLIVEYKKYLVLVIIPLSIGIILSQTPIHFGISSFVIIIGTLLAYTKLKLFTDDDLHNIIYAGFSKNLGDKIYPKLLKIMQKIK